MAVVLVLVAVAVDTDAEEVLVVDSIVVADWLVEDGSLLLVVLVARGETVGDDADVGEIIDGTEFAIVEGVDDADIDDKLVGEQDFVVLILLIKLLVLTLFRQLLNAELLRIRLVTTF